MATVVEKGVESVRAERRAPTGVVRRPNGAVAVAALGVALVVVMVLAIGIGPLWLAPGRVLDVILHQVGISEDPSLTQPEISVVWDIRLPRVLLAAMVGGGLAIAGASLQGLFGNSLADAGVIGITSGASLGAILVIVLNLSFFGMWTIPAGAFAAGLSTTSLIYALARPGAARGGTVQLLLVGIAVNAICGAIAGFFTYIASTTELESITFWSMGSLNRANWTSVAAGAPFFVAGIVALMYFYARPLDLLALGERQAQHVGVDVRRTRRGLIVVTALIVGGAVAFAGSIGFVGLVIPHLMRLLVGPGHRWLLPTAALGGATLLVLADIGARTLNPPSEIPIGLFMGVLGGPFFLWLLSRRRPELQA